MRGTKPNFAAAFRNFCQRSSPRSTRTSTSRVNRGRPSKEAATPPMISPGTCSDRNHLTSARSVASGGAVDALLATVCFQEPVPSLPDLSLPVGTKIAPTKVPSPGCECRQFLEFAPKGYPSPLRLFDSIDIFPSFFKRPRLSLSDAILHD